MRKWLFWLCLFPFFLKAQELDFSAPQKVIEKVEWFSSHSPLVWGKDFAVAVKFTLSLGMHVYAPGANQIADFLIPVSAKWETKGLVLKKVFWSQPKRKKDPSSGKILPMYEKEFWLYALFGWQKKVETVKLTLRLAYQACDAKGCYPPKEEKYTKEFVVGKKGILSHPKVFQKQPELWNLLQGKVSKARSAEKTRQKTTSFREMQKVEGSFEATVRAYGLFFALLLVFLWGLGSAFLPCVYPLIPLTVSFFIAQSGGKTLRRLAMASAYALGIVLSFTSLSIVATALFGTHLGSLFSYPWFVHSLFLFFFLLSLSMFGLFEIRLPASWTSQLQSSRGGLLGSFFMGAVLGVVASPCVSGPYAALLAFVMQGGNLVLASVAMTLYGLGLAFPFLLLAFFSNWLSSLPKPGGWMVRVRALMGLVILGVGVYFEQLGGFLTEENALRLYGALLVLAAPFLGAFDPVKEEKDPTLAYLFKGGGILLLAFGLSLFLFPKGFSPAPLESSEKREVAWQFDRQAVVDPKGYAREKRKYLLLFFSAKWCVYCHEMKKTVFRDPRVVEKIEKYFIPIYLDIDEVKEAKALKNRLGLAALPGFAFYSPLGELVLTSSKANTEEFLKILEKVLSKK